jgi:hypothetical protein
VPPERFKPTRSGVRVLALRLRRWVSAAALSRSHTSSGMFFEVGVAGRAAPRQRLHLGCTALPSQTAGRPFCKNFPTSQAVLRMPCSFKTRGVSALAMSMLSLWRPKPTNEVLDFSMARLPADLQRPGGPSAGCTGAALQALGLHPAVLQGSGRPRSQSHPGRVNPP